MPTELWGEGRVVGYSAYEIYVKQHLALNPTVKPATERQWLASSLASGASVLLKIVADSTSSAKAVTDNWSVDYKLPENSGVDYSLLCAANTIVGSFFVGSGGYADGSVFAHKVTSYGNLIKNASGAPATDGTTVDTTKYPLLSTGDFTEAMQKSLKSYMKIVDGIVIQPGTWSNTGTTPTRDETPDLSKSPTIRLHFRGPVKDTFELLLTGFSIRAVVAGESGVGGSVTDDARFNKDGAFLGPGQFPWANKIVFSIPNAFEQYLRYNGYSRKLPSSGTAQTPKGQPIIDMEKTDPKTYYSAAHTGFTTSSSKVDIDVTKLNVVPEEADVITVYQRNSDLPPAIYGSKVTATGSQSIYPLDTVAPGTVKMYTSEADAKTHQNNTPNNYSVYKNTTDNTVYHVKGSGASASGVPIARQDSANANYTHSSAAGSQTAQVVEISTGDIKRRVLSMQNASGTNRTISSPPTSKFATNDDDLYWAAFLDILANDKKIDILGDDLKKWKLILGQILSGPSDRRYIINISSDGELELREISLDVENIANGIMIKGHALGYLNFERAENPSETATTIKVTQLLFYQSIQGILPPTFVSDFSFNEATMVARLNTLNTKTFTKPIFNADMCSFNHGGTYVADPASTTRYILFADYNLANSSGQTAQTQWVVPIYPYVDGYYKLAVLWPAISTLSPSIVMNSVNPDYVGSYDDYLLNNKIKTHNTIRSLSPFSAVPTEARGVKVTGVDSIPAQITKMKSIKATQVTSDSQYTRKSLYDYILDAWMYYPTSDGKIDKKSPINYEVGYHKFIIKASIFTQYVNSGPINDTHIFGGAASGNFDIENELVKSQWTKSKVVPFPEKYASEILPNYYAEVNMDIEDSDALTQVKSPSLTDDKGINLDTYGMSGTISLSTGALSWVDLLVALGADKNIKIFGRNYIELPNGLRLYLSKTEPESDGSSESPRVGDLGIGWGEEE